MSTSVLLMCLIMIPVLISLCFIPYWTRRTESFGVSIPEKAYHLPELKKMRKQYAWIMAGIGLAVLAMFVPGSMVLNDEESLGLWFVFLLLFYLAAHFLAYLIFHRKMKALKQQADWGKEKKTDGGRGYQLSPRKADLLPFMVFDSLFPDAGHFDLFNPFL